MTVTLPTPKNWKTSLAGILGALAVNAISYFQSNQTIDWKVFSLSMMMVAVSFLAKDFNTTGGTNVQPSNEEAKLAILNPTAPEPVKPTVPDEPLKSTMAN
jgi:hypothetical protein